MAGITPTQRTLKLLKEKGGIVDICERWIRNPKHPAGGFRKDLFGFLDIIHLDPNRVMGIVGVQSCGQDFKPHLDKITIDCKENAVKWLEAGGKIHVYGWRKVKLKRGGKAMRWKPRFAMIFLEEKNLFAREVK
jgi:hypothetical protein